MEEVSVICSTCGLDNEKSVYQFYKIDDGRFLCSKCLKEERVCTECGFEPKKIETALNNCVFLAGKWYCESCAQFIEDNILDRILVSTTHNLEGYKIIEYIGIESAEVILGTGIFSEFVGAIADDFGLRSIVFENKLQESKIIAIKLLKRKAHARGANAIIGTDMDYTQFVSNQTGLILNGTLVKIEIL